MKLETRGRNTLHSPRKNSSSVLFVGGFNALTASVVCFVFPRRIPIMRPGYSTIFVNEGILFQP